MPAPILKIPVDDAAFQRYMAVFNKYQEQLKQQPEMWKGINEATSATAVAGAAVAAEIAHQADETRKLTEEEKKRDTDKRRAALDQANAEKARAAREENSLNRQKRSIALVKEYSRSMADAIAMAGKWALFGGGAGLIGGALSLWGLDRLVGGVGDQLRTSQGLGTSMGRQQGMGLNMQRYFDVNSVMENVANAKATPSEWSTFSMMGINPKGKDSAQLAGEAAIAARRMFIADHGNLQLAAAQHLTRIFSADDLRRLAATPEKNLAASLAQSRRFAADNGLRDSVGLKWQQFTIDMDKAGLAIKNKLIDKLTALEQPLGRVITAFTDLVMTALTPVNLKLLADGIDTFAKYIGSPQFKTDFGNFVTDVGAVASKLAGALKILGIIPDNGPATPAGVTPASDSIFPNKQRHWFSIRTPSKSTHEAQQQFMKWGWSGAQASGLASNLYYESKMDPFAPGDYNSKTHKYEAYGIGQWHADRQKSYKALFGHTMQSVHDAAQALREQMEFLQWELTSKDKRNHYKKAGDDLRRQRSAYGAAVVVSNEYEKPRDRAGEARRRGSLAVKLQLDIKNQVGASVATTANAAAGG